MVVEILGQRGQTAGQMVLFDIADDADDFPGFIYGKLDQLSIFVGMEDT